MRERLERIGAAIARERPDLVVLSEIVSECGPVDVDQVEVLAEACGFHACVASDNYSFGLPFFRIRSGNAILSKFPLREPSVQQLAGEKPSWRPTNNRRALWCEVDLGGTWWLVGSVRNDSFDAANNELQTLEILSFGGARAALIAGDFNASPDSSSMARIHDSGRFAPTADRRSTFPRVQPTRRIDYVFGPASWRLLAERVVDCGTSDHLAVVSDFRLP